MLSSIEHWNQQERIRAEAERALVAQVTAERRPIPRAVPPRVRPPKATKAPKIPRVLLTPSELLARARDRQYQKLYGISLAGYDLLLEKQEGVCAICRKSPGARRLVVDHCHTTQHVRGLLCYRCNLILGLGEDDSPRLQRAVSYLIFG